MAEIRLFAADFQPKTWAYCNGQILAISTNQALFSLLGITYGGNGVTTFALPDLRSRVAIGTGPSTAGSSYTLGQFSGTENNTLLSSNLPAHIHTVQPLVLKVSNADGTQSDPTASVNTLGGLADASGSGTAPNLAYNNLAPDIPLNVGPASSMTGTAGSSQPVSNIEPSLGMHYIICLYGIYPSRN